jgi:trk system potassium uptake protein TrkH
MLNHSGGMQMFNAEVTGITHDKIRPRISQTAKSLWLTYFVLTIALFVLLLLGPMNLFDSLCHAFSTISTGGFSTRDNSIGAWDTTYVKTVVTIFMFLGGVNFTILFRAMTGHVEGDWKNDTFRTYVKTIGIMYVLFVISIVLRHQVISWHSVTIDPLFQIVSTITSTGYTAQNFEAWGTFVLSLIFVMMFCGSCAGSTSGGAKIDRVLFLIKNCRNELYRCVHPNSILAVRVNGKVVSHDLVNKVIAFLSIYMMLIVVGGIVLTAFRIPLVDAFFSSFSCMSNTGLGAGVTGYGGSYEIIPDVGKWILSALMLIGRLEIYTILIIFTPAFWRK